VEEENEAKLLRTQNQLLQVQNQMLQDHLSGVLNVQEYQYDSLYPSEQNPEKGSVSYIQPPPSVVLPSTSTTVPLEPPPDNKTQHNNNDTPHGDPQQRLFVFNT
jgi:hypothetical protein